MEKKRKYTFDFHQRWEKILLILRATLLVVVISTLNIEANASAQVIKVSLKMENATIDEMIKTIRTETNYRFLYRVEEVNKYGKRDIKRIHRGISKNRTRRDKFVLRDRKRSHYYKTDQ